jgi:HD superfamily phosphohydrolase YqeK
MKTDSNGMPSWAVVGEKRLDHIARVTSLLRAWAASMRLSNEETIAWTDAGVWHDSLRDASEEKLRKITGDMDMPAALLHGPAAAVKLEKEGEKRKGVLDAIRYHTVGSAKWDRTGRALYMADYLEPGRKFSREDRNFLAAQVPTSFDAVFRQVVRFRLDWSVREGNHIYQETVELWNSLR